MELPIVNHPDYVAKIVYTEPSFGGGRGNSSHGIRRETARDAGRGVRFAENHGAAAISVRVRSCNIKSSEEVEAWNVGWSGGQ